MIHTRIAINGFGRIGRLFFRQIFGIPGVEVVAINDLGDIENLAYLLKYDSVYRTYEKKIEVAHPVTNGRGELLVDGKSVIVFQEKDPARLPWNAMKIDVAVESTGVFESFEKSRAHLVAGAKRVVISAPAKDEEQADAKTVLLGMNEEQFKACKVTSNGSCTTSATYPVAAVMHESVGVLKAFLATTHGYTATQNLVDGSTRGKDFRRGRAGAINIAPSSTGAAISVTRVLKDLEGKFDGIALRVPIPSGSLADFTFLAKRKTSVEEVNDIFRKAAKSAQWKGILDVTEDQLVSSDIIGCSAASVVDLQYTKVVDGDFVKVLAWYDNEWGYVTTLVKHVMKVAELL
ncbi:MAG: type I glyceraldehyde-3-phosphate dehydrogenase [bacterium]|nr:type I glyceraldehyde-3-phosphate dehydrogenase [bacterium]